MLGTPARWASTCPTVIACLRLMPYPGMYSATGSSRPTLPCSMSPCTTNAVMALEAEYTQKGVSVATGTLGASGASPGPLPRAWPMARSSTTLP